MCEHIYMLNGSGVWGLGLGVIYDPEEGTCTWRRNYARPTLRENVTTNRVTLRLIAVPEELKT